MFRFTIPLVFTDSDFRRRPSTCFRIMQSVQADITSVTFVAISKDSGTDHANTEADECDGTFSGQEFPDKKSAAFGAISKDAGTENASLEDDASAGTGLAPDLPDEHCATLSETDGSVTEPIVRNEEPLPDGWWFIPPNVSLEQYLAAGVASDTTRTKTEKSKKKRKAHTGATHANDSTAPQADLLPGTASATKANDDIEPQADASQETAANAECEQTIPLTTVAPNLEAAGTVIASLLERFPQEFANFNAKLWEFYGANVAVSSSARPSKACLSRLERKFHRAQTRHTLDVKRPSIEGKTQIIG